MKTITQVCILILMFLSAGGQSIEELKSIGEKSRNPFITPDDLDRLMISLREYEDTPLPDQDSLILDVYKSITASYVTSSHYKQGLSVFNKYLTYKENVLTKDKADALSILLNSIAERSRNDESDLVMLQNKLSTLKSDNEILSKNILLFKSYFSLILIILSVIFAVILVGYAIRSFSLRSRLIQNRNMMKSIHHLALTGKYEEGVRNTLQNSITSAKVEIAELKKFAF